MGRIGVAHIEIIPAEQVGGRRAEALRSVGSLGEYADMFGDRTAIKQTGCLKLQIVVGLEVRGRSGGVLICAGMREADDGLHRERQLPVRMLLAFSRKR